MKETTKIILLMIVFVFSSCYDSDSDSEPQEPEDPRYLYLSFMFEDMTSIDQIETSNDHTYMMEGYTVSFSGGISEVYETIHNVDLGEPLKFEANDDVVVSVSHPDFDETEVTEKAYYGIQEYHLDIETVDAFSLMLQPLQGYVIVTTDDEFDYEKYSLTINNSASDFNSVYYVSKQKVVSKITYDAMAVEIGDFNVIGDGLVYYAYEDEDGNLIFI